MRYWCVPIGSTTPYTGLQLRAAVIEIAANFCNSRNAPAKSLEFWGNPFEQCRSNLGTCSCIPGASFPQRRMQPFVALTKVSWNLNKSELLKWSYLRYSSERSLWSIIMLLGYLTQTCFRFHTFSYFCMQNCGILERFSEICTNSAFFSPFLHFNIHFLFFSIFRFNLKMAIVPPHAK